MQEVNNTWQILPDGLYKELLFADFLTAFAFIQKVALLAEELQHHPLWTNHYNKVSIKLYTFDANAITELDFILSQKIEDILMDFPHQVL